MDTKKILALCQKAGIPIAGANGSGKPKVNDKMVCFNGLEKCGHIQRELGITWPCKGARGFAVVVEKETDQEVIGNKLQEIEMTRTDGQKFLATLIGNPLSWSLDDKDVGATWFAGAKLKTRTCSGDCSHETLYIPQEFEAEKWQEPKDNGKYFDCTKTAFKPYDIAVTAVLIAAKHYFGPDISIHSDGESEHWDDGREICQKLFGYGKDFELDKD